METKYKLNNKELVINIYGDNYKTQEKELENWYSIINNLILENNLKFKGKKILIYKNNIYMGYFSLTKFFLRKLYFRKIIFNINKTNSYFYPNLIMELKPNSKRISKKRYFYLRKKLM